MPHGETRRSSACKSRLTAVLCVGLLVGGCSGDSTTQTVPKIGGFTLAANPLTPQIQAGTSGNVDVSVTRTGGFSGPVVFALSGQPTGITATYSAPQTSGAVTAARATLLVDSTVTPGPYYFRLNASGGGMTANVDLGLQVVRPPADFTVAVAPSPTSILPGGLWTVQVTVATSHFQNELVHLDLLNAPAGVSGSFRPDTVSGGNSTLTLVVDPAVAPGNYNLTVQGSGPDVPTRSGPLTLTVIQSTGGLGVSLDFSECAASSRPTWLAVQDGAGAAWIPVAGSAGVYQAGLTQPKVGIAYTLGGSQPGLRVSYLTRAEVVAAQPYGFCHQAGNPSVSGTAAGLASGESAYIAMGDGVTAAATNGAFLLYPVLNGPHDLVGYKSSILGAGISDRFFLLRDQDPGSGVGTIDFGGADSFAPIGAPMQLVGASPGAGTTQTMAFLTGAGCDFSLLYSASPITGPDFMAYGAPAAMLRPSDFHQLVITSTDPGNTSFRTVAETFRRVAPRVLVLGAMLPAMSIVTLPGAYKRLEADGFPSGDYQSNAFFSYFATFEGKTHLASIVASSGWMGGSEVTLVMPDLTGLPGFDASAPPRAEGTGTWSFTVTGMSGASLCTEGARTTTATRTGVF